MQLLSWRQNRWRHAKHLKTWQYRPQPIRAQCEQGRGPIRDGVTGATCKTAWLLTKTWHSLPACLGSFLWWKLGVSHFTESRTPSHWIETSWFLTWRMIFYLFHQKSFYIFVNSGIYEKCSMITWTFELSVDHLYTKQLLQNECCLFKQILQNTL